MKRFNFASIIGGVIVFTITAVNAGYVSGENIGPRFKDQDKLVYEVNFNGIPSGHIEWEYLGQEDINGVTADILLLNSDTKILKLLSLAGKEKVFLDSRTGLPLRVERDIVFFGRKERISETYNQDVGYIRINKSNSQNRERVIYQDKPIHNILELLYFFPQDLALTPGKWMSFNLPTQKIKIKMVRERVLKADGKNRDTYFLVGKGARRFNLWLDKAKKIPLRLEFISLAGKVTILRSGEL
ncbi:MAG: hypothetical protein ABIE75_04925 [Candidatus Omnitrophota bacterium]